MHRSTKHTAITITIIVLCIVLFCVPMTLRRRVYKVTETSLTSADVLVITNGISSVWCSAQTLASTSNTTFLVHLLPDMPDIIEETEISTFSGRSELRVSEIEYWGFYLLKGSKLNVSACGRLSGSSVTVMRGQKALVDCTKKFKEKDIDLSEESSEETLEDDEYSSISSSEGALDDVEEGIFKCPEQSVIQRKLHSNFSCYLDIDNKTSVELYYNDQLIVDESDYYYVVFSGGAILQLIPNVIYWNMILARTTYNLTSSLNNCSSEELGFCTMPLKFRSSQVAVVSMSAGVNGSEPRSDTILSTCEPRRGLFFVFFLAIFVAIGICAFQ